MNAQTPSQGATRRFWEGRGRGGRREKRKGEWLKGKKRRPFSPPPAPNPQISNLLSPNLWGLGYDQSEAEGTFSFDKPIRVTQCCTQFKSPEVNILCVLYLHYNVAFTFKWYGNSWNKTFYSQRVWIGYNIELAKEIYSSRFALALFNQYYAAESWPALSNKFFRVFLSSGVRQWRRRHATNLVGCFCGRSGD